MDTPFGRHDVLSNEAGDRVLVIQRHPPHGRRGWAYTVLDLAGERAYFCTTAELGKGGFRLEGAPAGPTAGGSSSREG